MVSLLVSYAPEDLADDEFGPPGPNAAAAAALALTRDGGSDGTVWHVYDRETGESHRLEQRDFEDDEG